MLIASVAAATAGCGSSDRNRLVSVPWTLVRSEGRRLTIQSVSGGCDSFDHIRPTETDQQVSVAVYNLLTRTAGEACPADAIVTRSTITLHHPLGTRKLVHAPVAPGASA